MPIRQVKEQLEFKFGSPADNVTLQLKDSAGNFVVEMSNNHESLEFYGS